MAEKKIVTLGVRMDEPMLMALKGIAEADGMTESELVRTLISTLITERAAYYARLHSIFGDGALDLKRDQVKQGAAEGGPPPFVTE